MEKYRRSSADNEQVVQAQAMFYKVGHLLRSFGPPTLPIQYRLPMSYMIGTTHGETKLQRCDSLDGSGNHHKRLATQDLSKSSCQSSGTRTANGET
jgi:hypothetical protein